MTWTAPRRGASAIVALIACLAASLLLAPAARSAGTLDQSQTDVAGSGFLVTDEFQMAQTFTAGITGALDQVDLVLGISIPPLPDIQVRVVALAADGTPTGATLASGAVPSSAVPPASATDWVQVPLSPPAPVTAGVAYAILATAPGAVSQFYVWDSGSPAYSRGIPWIKRGADPWVPRAEQDTGFKTYVSAAVTAESLCNDTLAALRSSPKYPANKPALEAAGARLCKVLAAFSGRLSAAQKRQLVNAYKASLPGLVRSGWLTAAQASDLAAKAERLLSG